MFEWALQNLKISGLPHEYRQYQLLLYLSDKYRTLILSRLLDKRHITHHHHEKLLNYNMVFLSTIHLGINVSRPSCTYSACNRSLAGKTQEGTSETIYNAKELGMGTETRLIASSTNVPCCSSLGDCRSQGGWGRWTWDRHSQTCPQTPSSLPSAAASSCPETSPSAAS